MTPLQSLACEWEDARLVWQADAGNMSKLDAFYELSRRIAHYTVPEILATIPAPMDAPEVFAEAA